MLFHIALGTALAVTLLRNRQLRKTILIRAERARNDRKITAATEAAYKAQLMYLVDMLQKNGIVPTEFDMIALRNIVNDE